MKRKLMYGIVGALLFMIIGFLIGTAIGGNYFPDFKLWTWVGYEATGWLGIILGALIGATIGIKINEQLSKQI